MSKIIEKLQRRDVGFWVLLLLILLFLMGLIAYCVATGASLKEVSDIKDLLKDVLLMLVAYRWGSSRGSKEKTDMLGKAAENTK